MGAVSLENCPVIAAVKNEAQLKKALQTEGEVIFLLFGDILNISSLTETVSAAGKKAIVHLDLVGGLAGKEIAVDFIAKTTKAAGIISTKPALIRRAKELGLFTVLRAFAIDSMALQNIRKERELVKPDVMEILPGVIPEVLSTLSAESDTPIIAGGLVKSKQEILRLLQAGAAAVSTSEESLWDA